MITPEQMYWLTRLDGISCTITICTILLCVAYGIGLMFGLFRSCLVPTTREMAAILIVPRIANSEKVQQAGNKLYDLAVEWMDELKSNKNNNKEGKR